MMVRAETRQLTHSASSPNITSQVYMHKCRVKSEKHRHVEPIYIQSTWVTNKSFPNHGFAFVYICFHACSMQP